MRKARALRKVQGREMPHRSQGGPEHSELPLDALEKPDEKGIAMGLAASPQASQQAPDGPVEPIQPASAVHEWALLQ